MKMNNQFGFMQGRLVDQVEGKIQAFPWLEWELEFKRAREVELSLMEWTLDADRIYENPLMTSSGIGRIRDLSSLYNVNIHSLTGDFLMQAPFYKTLPIDSYYNQVFDDVLEACFKLGIKFLVFPLVDNGKISNEAEEDILVDYLTSKLPSLAQKNIKIVFESDYRPSEVKRLINRLPSDSFGINYDIGNSASLGFDPEDEFEEYGKRIYNVHVKDRLLGGTTVPLGTGDADFKKVFKLLAKFNYQGYLILQTARAHDKNHLKTISEYVKYTKGFME